MTGTLLATSPGEGPEAAWWVDGLGYVLVVPAAVAGGWLAARRQPEGHLG